jgi:hypothetical protein
MAPQPCRPVATWTESAFGSQIVWAMVGVRHMQRRQDPNPGSQFDSNYRSLTLLTLTP